MGKTNLGRVSVAPRGAYNNETSYKRLDVVEYEGSSYLFLKDSTGIIPTADGEVTMLLAKRGKDFAYEDFTPEQLAALKGADGNDGVNGSDGTKGDKGEPGKGFTILGYYGTLDLLKAAVPTPEPGDAYGIGTAAPYDIYVFDRVTSGWVDNGKLSGTKGDKGDKGTKGDKGDPGKGLTILGYYDTLDQLKIAISNPAIGDAYGVGEVASYDIYVYDGVTDDWVNNGILSGGGGEGDGNVVLIPAEVMGLSNTSTSEEILTAWGGKENLISICKRICDRNSIIKAYIEGEQMSVIFTFSGSHYEDDNNMAIAFGSSANSASSTLLTRLTNGVALFEATNMENIERILLADSIFDLTSESTSEQILNVLGGMDRINYIYDRIGRSAELNTILIVDNRKLGNGYSVLHNFGGSYIDPSQNKGFNRQIYFCCTSIEPAVEIIRWVIKFNDTSAACEVTKKEVGGASSEANIVIVPMDVIETLGNESTSEQIINAFGGIQAFNDIVDKLSKGDAITAVASYNGNNFGSMPCLIAINNYVDYSNLDMQLIVAVAGDTLILGVTVENSVFSAQKAALSVLKSSDLVSDPAVGGTDKPASAEAVKVMNDKIGWTPDLDSTVEQICTGELFTDFTGTKKQVYYKSRRVSGTFSAMADGYYSWNASIIPASYTALSATGLAEILGANNVKIPIMIGVNGYPMINSTAYINSGWLSVVVKPGFQINTEIVCNAVCNIKYIKP